MLLQKWLLGGGSIEELNRFKGINAKRHQEFPHIILFKYDQIGAPEGDPLVNECRGVILDESDNWRVVSRAFDRFYNYGSVHCQEIDWTTARVQEKLDGSLAVMYYYEGEWRVATSGTPDASGNINGGSKTFKDYFWEAYGDRELPDHTAPIQSCLVFELTGPLNRVVVPHNEVKLTLLTVRNVDDTNMSEWPRWAVDHVGYQLGFDVVKEFPLQSIDDISKTFETMNPLHQEGYVVVDGNFNRVKVKHPGYVALHHAKDGMGPKAFLEVARKGETSEVAIAFPEFGGQIEKAAGAIRGLEDCILEAWDSLGHRGLQDAPQKDFAIGVMTYHKEYSAALFAIRSKKTPNASTWVNNLSIDKLLEYLPAEEWM